MSKNKLKYVDSHKYSNGLLRLPNEILHPIMKALDLNDIESFALSCETVYAACEDIIKEHNHYRKRFSRDY